MSDIVQVPRELLGEVVTVLQHHGWDKFADQFRAILDAPQGRAGGAMTQDERMGVIALKQANELIEKLMTEQEAAKLLCAIYFDIAAGVMGEGQVRELRDERIKAVTNA